MHRRYRAGFRDPVFDSFGGSEDDSFSLYGQVSRRLSRTSEINFDAYASWYDSNLAGFDEVFSTGGTVSYTRSFLLDRLQLLAALGIYHSDDGTTRAPIASGLDRPAIHFLEARAPTETRMYTEHFGLTGQPFQLTPDARFWFESRTHRKAMAYLGYGLAQGEGFIVVTGEIGAGKSTLVAHLLASIDRARLNAIAIVSTQVEGDDMLRLVAAGPRHRHEGRSRRRG